MHRAARPSRRRDPCSQQKCWAPPGDRLSSPAGRTGHKQQPGQGARSPAAMHRAMTLEGSGGSGGSTTTDRPSRSTKQIATNKNTDVKCGPFEHTEHAQQALAGAGVKRKGEQCRHSAQGMRNEAASAGRLRCGSHRREKAPCSPGQVDACGGRRLHVTCSIGSSIRSS